MDDVDPRLWPFAPLNEQQRLLLSVHPADHNCEHDNTSKTTTSTSTTSKATTSTTTSTTKVTSSTTTSSTTTSSAAVQSGSGPNKTIAKVPVLGWNSWNGYGSNINEALVLAVANNFTTLGLKAAGYTYVNIDDTWSNITGRDPTTQRIKPDSNKFPNGIASIVTQIHNLGLKFGIYGDAGTTTCAGFPGSLYYETIDAQTFSDWGVDLIKYDNCAVPANWSDTGHSWRLTGDASASWSFVTSEITTAASVSTYTNFYGHGDMDMMEIGNGGLSSSEERTHFAAWCFLKSPILLGTNLGNLTPAQIAVITNAELLAFSQDTTYGAAAKQYDTTSPPVFFSGTSTAGAHAFGINYVNSTASLTFNFTAIPELASKTSWKVHDMWTKTDIGTYSGSYTASVAGHDTAALRFT
ncbi:hypothetical protein FRB93_010932 [Tulasnella sp. JGI-2019a]|nr:hypothetical protein FRB93_010932 [Tulasnella sp. JGI-2019a]